MQPTGSTAPDPAPGAAVAGVDLGSNSFHLVVARHEGDRLVVLDRIKERVALAEGLEGEGGLAPEARERALACLGRFRQRIQEIPPDRVRAVGTDSFRALRDGGGFLGQAREALGCRIDVVSGAEEARLVYAGARHDLGRLGERLLVVDIGGGSTELVVGSGVEPEAAESLHAGCVTWMQRQFPGGAVDRKRFGRAVIAARQELEPFERKFRRLGWNAAVGCSGTLLALEAISREAGYPAGIGSESLAHVRGAIESAREVDQIVLPGLREDRRPVIAGGLAILIAVFEALELERLETSHGALREGLLLDLLGRLHRHDPREASVRGMLARYRVDQPQARRVKESAARLFRHLAPAWGCDHPEAARFLGWAACMHEVGLAVSHVGHHKHGAYLAAHADLPGFSRDEQAALSALVLLHRRRLRPEALEVALPGAAGGVLPLALMLRLAVALHRSRTSRPLPPFRIEAGRRSARLAFPPGWLGAHPLTAADLETEAGVWLPAGWLLCAE